MSTSTLENTPEVKASLLTLARISRYQGKASCFHVESPVKGCPAGA